MGSRHTIVTQTTHGKLPRLPFERIKNAVLGKSYHLSLVFAGDTRMRKLNSTYRKKDYVPNVLAFPLSPREGEIFINPNRVEIEAKRYNLSKQGYTAYLFIHAMLHLKGMPHSATMEKHERALLRRFAIS